MAITPYPLYKNEIPGFPTEIPSIIHHAPAEKKSRAAVIIFPGGGYAHRAHHEGTGYAQFLAGIGVSAFVVNYRVTPAYFPVPLLDARRAVRFVRANAEAFGIDADKVLVMGSSAGGHLAALVSTYRAPIDGEGVDEIDALDPIPNAQVLCYPVISSDEAISHMGSYKYLLGDRYGERDAYSPERLVDKSTPPAFIWHTATDTGVNVENSYRYATALRRASVPCEMHIFPLGPHGLGLAPTIPHVAQWAGLFKNWLILLGFRDADQV